MLKIIRENPLAFALAVLAHALLGLFLTFSLDWNRKHEVAAPKVNVIQAVMIDESKIRAEQERLRKIEEEKKRKLDEARKRKEADKKHKLEEEKKRKQEAEKKRKAEAEKKHKAEAEKKRKVEAEKKRKAEEQHKKQEAEKKRQAEELRKKREVEAERLRKLEEQKRKREAEEARLRAEEEALRQKELAEEAAAMQAARQRALQSERDKYIGLIRLRVESKWAKPSGWRPGISCSVRVRLVPGAGTGQVIDAQIVKSCGNQLFDRSVESAVFSASPLPFPQSPELMQEFRDITFNFEPEG